MKVVIVDDDCFVTASLKTILESSGEIVVSGVGNSGNEAIALYEREQPDVLLMDIRMQDMTGLEAAGQILRKDENAKILFLTTFTDDEYIVQALHIGAKGYILKQDFESILPALKTVYAGQSVFGGEIITKIPEILGQNDTFKAEEYGITKKEYDIMKLVAEGLSNKEIAAELFLSEGTVRNYLSGLLDKLELRDRTQLAIFYYQHK